MEPRIQYARTEDGVSIAFWTLGEGPPLVQMPNFPLSHTQLDWQSGRASSSPIWGTWCRRASRSRWGCTRCAGGKRT